MRVLVLGAGGMAGHVIAIRLSQAGHDVKGFARRELPFCKTIIGDAMTADLPEIVQDFDAVINCIGVLNRAVDADLYSGIYLNSCLPHLLSKHAKRVIHLSTDCVFSGHDGGGYIENSFRSADSLYGRSKALGELINDKDLTIRTSIVGPDMNPNGIGLFNWFMQQSGSVNGYSGAIWSGVSTPILADAIDAALKQGLIGLYHLVNNEIISKFELIGLFNGLRKEPVEIVPFDAVKENKSLIDTRTDFDFVVPLYTEMVMTMRRWISEHQSLYLRYDIQECL